jgi:hypothetical protein
VRPKGVAMAARLVVNRLRRIIRRRHTVVFLFCKLEFSSKAL